MGLARRRLTRAVADQSPSGPIEDDVASIGVLQFAEVLDRAGDPHRTPL